MKIATLILSLLVLSSCRSSVPEKVTPKSASIAAGTGTGEPSTSKDPTLSLDCIPTPVKSPLQRLSIDQYRNAIADLFALPLTPDLSLPADENIGPFVANTASEASALTISQYEKAAQDIGAAVSLNASSILPCISTALSVDCAAQFANRIAQKAFRRAPSTDEKTRFRALAATMLANGKPELMIPSLVEAILQSPYFIYRLEVGEASATDGIKSLTQIEYATRLASALWNTIPDDTLLNTALANTLGTDDEIKAQIDRMILNPKFSANGARLVRELLDIDSIATLTKDPTVFPGFDTALRTAFADETNAFTRYVLDHDDARLDTLLTAPYSILSDRLFGFYGITKMPSWTPGSPVLLGSTGRSGLLTQGAFLSTQAHAISTSVVKRGKVIRENLLCQSMPAPPPNLPALPVPSAVAHTAKQIFAIHEANPSCAGCHKLMDPIGLAFENFDGIGAYRALELGTAIDPSGTLTSPSMTASPFQSPKDLGALLAGNTDTQNCFVLQSFRFALQRPEADADQCSLVQLRAAFTDSQHDIKALMRSIVTSRAFRSFQEVIP